MAYTVPPASLVYYGHYALQHRGQEGCGIVVNDDGVFTGQKGLGLISAVFGPEEMKRFPHSHRPGHRPGSAGRAGGNTLGISTIDE